MHSSSIQPMAASMQHRPERELDLKVKRASVGVNETVHMIANEPSLGLYRIQQHVKKTLPRVVNASNDMKKTNDQIKGLVYDANYATDAIGSIINSSEAFSNIEKLLRESTSNAAIVKMKKSTSAHVL
ncbi:BLOC-1-related complex subunit 8-like [Styela clava]